MNILSPTSTWWHAIDRDDAIDRWQKQRTPGCGGPVYLLLTHPQRAWLPRLRHTPAAYAIAVAADSSSSCWCCHCFGLWCWCWCCHCSCWLVGVHLGVRECQAVRVEVCVDVVPGSTATEWRGCCLVLLVALQSSPQQPTAAPSRAPPPTHRKQVVARHVECMHCDRPARGRSATHPSALTGIAICTHIAT
jgi:hypothetical protein